MPGLILKWALFGLLNLLIAIKKGFNPWPWLLAAGLLGAIVVALLPSAAEEGLDDVTPERRRSTATKTGLVLSIVAVALAVVTASICGRAHS